MPKHTKKEEQQLSKMLELWESMDGKGRREVLEFARKVAKYPNPPMTKAQFDALSYEEQLAAIHEDPDLLPKLR